MNRRSIVCSVEREYFFMYVNYYNALTLKKYARNFDSRDFLHTFSCCPFLFHSLTLYDFHKGEVGIGKKYAELAYAQLERGGWQAPGGGQQRIHYSLFVRSNEQKKYCLFSGASGIFLHVRKLLQRPNFEKVRQEF